MEIKKVGVIGAGVMGNGIAHIFAQTGYEVIMIEASLNLAEKGKAVIAKNLDRMVKKETITAEIAQETLGKISVSENLGDLACCQIVVEAVTENRLVKYSIYEKLNGILTPETIMASNTSTKIESCIVFYDTIVYRQNADDEDATTTT